jgi:hypothetical protein
MAGIFPAVALPQVVGSEVSEVVPGRVKPRHLNKNCSSAHLSAWLNGLVFE